MHVKKVVTGVCAAALAASGAFAMGGCSTDVSSVVDEKGTRAEHTTVVSIEASEVERALYETAIEGGLSDAEAKLAVSMAPMYIEQLGLGIHYNAASDGEEATYSIEGASTTANEYYYDTIALYPKGAAYLGEAQGATSGITQEQLSDLEKLLGNKPMTVTWTFDFSGRKPLETNLTAVPGGKYAYTASLTAQDLAALSRGEDVAALADVAYARFTDEALTTSTVKAKSAYTTKQYTEIKTPGIISKISVNGKALSPTDVVPLGKEGKKTIAVTLTNGNSKTLSVTYDKTAPAVSAKAGKTYKRGYKLTFKDSLAGVKTATLNGKKVKSGAKITKKGSYKLVVTDKAGNAKTVKFKIK